MNQFLTTVSTVAAALVLTACASTTVPLSNGRITPAAGEGVAIISLTGESSNIDMASASLGISGGAKPITLSAQFGNEFIQAPGSQSNVAGNVFVVPLVAGDYQVDVAKGVYVIAGNKSGETLYANLPIKAPFSIKAGEVVYLGGVNMQLSFQSSFTMTNNPALDLFDLKARDGVTDQTNIVQRPLQNFAPAKVY